MPEEQTMNLSLIADYADVLAALGIMASLAFLAWQIRKNTAELKNTHQESLIDRYNSLHSRLYDQITAAVVLKGRQSFELLEGVERLAFESWMQACA